MPRSSLTHYFGLGPTVRPLNVVALASSALLSISFLVFLNSVQPFFLTSVLHPPVPRDRLGQVTGTLILADELLSLLLVFAWGVVADRVTVRWVAVAGHIIAGGGLGLYTLSKRVYPDVLLSRLVFATGASALVMVLGAALAGMTAIPKDSPVEESSETTALLPAAAPNPAHSARFAGLLGFSSGIGALLAVFGFLRLPTALSPLFHDSLEKALRVTFYGISGLAVAEGIFLSWGLKPKAVEHAEEAAGEVAVEHEPVRWTKRVSGVGHELTRGLRIASGEPEIALAYFSGFAARGQSIAISAFIPLFINEFFLSSDLCTSLAPSETCRPAIILTAILTGTIQLVTLLLSPVFGLLASHLSPALTLSLSSLLGAISFVALGTTPDPRAGLVWLWALGIGASHSAGIVVSLALVARGRSHVMAKGARGEVGGAISGAYAACGGLGILVVGKTGGTLFDRGSAEDFGSAFAGVVTSAANSQGLESQDEDATWTSNPTRAPPKAARGGRAGIDDDARGGLREPAAEECVGGDTSSDSTRYTPDLEEEPPVEKAGDRKRAKDADSEVIWVEWDDKDPENPFEWTLARRWRITLISCLFSFVSSFAGTSFSMGIPSMRVDLKCSAELASMGLAAFPLGFGFAPLVLAPFSEAYGRYLMYCVTVVVYTIFLIPVSRARNAATIIVCRLIAGLACSTGSTLVGGTIADLFHAKDRGPVMSLFTFTTFLGTSFGPASMGWVALKLGWRWIQYILIIMSVVLGLLVIFLTEETRGSVILSRRAAKLRSSTSDPRYQCRSDAERASLLILIKVSMSRPIYLLATEPVVFSFSLWVGLAWGIMFLTLEAVPDVMGTVYNFNQGEIGLTFLAIALGGAFGHLMNIYQERVYQRTVAKRGPEARLYMACFGGLLLPAGMWIFAFSQGWGYWLGPVCGMVVLFTGIFAVYLAAFNYLADCYNVYASSAMSGQSLARNLCGAIFPLFTQQMYTRLGFQWASFLAGCLAAVLATLPWILMAYGPRIRAASKFAKNLAAHHQ